MSFRAPSVNHIYQTPLSSSELTKINKNRMLYANYIIKVQDNNVGCDTARTGLQNGGVAPGSIIPDLLVGARFTTSAERDRILATSACQFPSAPAVNPGIGGSMLFDPNLNTIGSQVTYPNDSDLALGDGDFTIEWFQYWIDDSPPFQRPFSVGAFGEGTPSIAVSYENSGEGGSTYFWVNGSGNIVNNELPPLNTWTHIAVVGTGGTDIAFYINGTRVYNETLEGGYNFTDTTTALSIGNETEPDNDPPNLAAFNGQITNFRWVKGTALYSGATLTVPTQPLTAVSGTELLLLASTEGTAFVDSSPANRTPTVSGAVYSSTNPF
jgi:hypothetical protein